MAKKKRRKNKNKIPEIDRSITESRIKTDKPPDDPGCFVFNFSLLDLNHSKFNSKKEKAEYFVSLLGRLAKFSKIRVRDILNTSNRPYHFHFIDWEKAKYPEGFSCLNEQYRDFPPYQFGVGGKNKKARVYGLLDGSMFFVVWIDPKHSLY